MLIGEDGRGRSDSSLLPFHNRLECCTHRYFGFAVTDVPTEQTIHWHRFFHVFLYIIDRRLLIGSQYVSKAVFKFLLPRSISSKRITTDKFALGIQSEHFVAHVAHGTFCFCFVLLPAKPSEPIELWAMALSARVTLNQVESFNWNVE